MGDEQLTGEGLRLARLVAHEKIEDAPGSSASCRRRTLAWTARGNALGESSILSGSRLGPRCRAKRLQAQHWAFPFALAPIERGRGHELLRIVRQMSEERVPPRGIQFAKDVVNQEQRSRSPFLP